MGGDLKGMLVQAVDIAILALGIVPRLGGSHSCGGYITKVVVVVGIEMRLCTSMILVFPCAIWSTSDLSLLKLV